VLTRCGFQTSPSNAEDKSLRLLCAFIFLCINTSIYAEGKKPQVLLSLCGVVFRYLRLMHTVDTVLYTRYDSQAR
jgi:hypothetical protein